LGLAHGANAKHLYHLLIGERHAKISGIDEASSQRKKALLAQILHSLAG